MSRDGRGPRRLYRFVERTAATCVLQALSWCRCLFSRRNRQATRKCRMPKRSGPAIRKCWPPSPRHGQASISSWRSPKNPEPGMSVFKLKAIVRDGKKLETFWITPFRAVGEDFEGVVANTPEIVGNVSLGETIRIPRADVADWGYVRNGRQWKLHRLRAVPLHATGDRRLFSPDQRLDC